MKAHFIFLLCRGSSNPVGDRSHVVSGSLACFCSSFPEIESNWVSGLESKEFLTKNNSRWYFRKKCHLQQSSPPASLTAQIRYFLQKQLSVKANILYLRNYKITLFTSELCKVLLGCSVFSFCEYLLVILVCAFYSECFQVQL